MSPNLGPDDKASKMILLQFQQLEPESGECF